MNQSNAVHDLLVIGGGINGVGIAADAAGRGLSVVLCEKSDLAAATSSNSTKLIHGGLRYLEHYEFGLVRRSLREREILAASAPHIIKPLAFRIPRLAHSRNPLLIRAGLLIYDNLAKRRLFPRSRSIAFDEDSPLNEEIRRGFEYWDAQVEDARLVVLNARLARSQGAEIRPRTECTALESVDGHWSATLLDHRSGEQTSCQARAVVNAAGPWVASLDERLTGKPAAYAIRQVKGSHLVVPRLYAGEHAYLLQHTDGRVVFMIPYLDKYSLIGTTEEMFTGDLDEVEISAGEIAYLLDIANQYLKTPIDRSQVLHTFSAIRPLIDQREKSMSSVSRDYRIELVDKPHPYMSIYGGKITTYRVLAESALANLARFFPGIGPAWTSKVPLPGGDFATREELFREVAGRYSWLGPDLINRWVTSYGTLLYDILRNARGSADLGVKFGKNLYQREVDYLCQEEWAMSAEDVLWRRGKLGYQFDTKDVMSLDNYIGEFLRRSRQV